MDRLRIRAEELETASVHYSFERLGTKGMIAKASTAEDTRA